ncbi:zinc ribbon domain-containing protein [Agathobaculum sp. Marseille-P7918]|uniref:zinc ribbon domain-containing protein n=1 Tax=Agathobaculum sp. Marseille-P7918 TaxID=2479843 RepID=UPI000F62FD1B|nr:zinc ribbon domain-containing protein [Agathobaculum sp. Marseille-P7918]
MKCQHCGINYSDEDRECPICGARAGTRGRVGELEKKAAAWREKQFEDEPTYRKTHTRAKKAKPSAKPIRETKKGKGKVAAVVAAAVVLLNVLPSAIPLLQDFADNLGDSFRTYQEDLGWGSSEQEAEAWDSYDDGTVYYTPGETYEYDEDHYVSVYAILYDLIDGHAAATLADGTTVDLQAEPGEMSDYTLTISDGTGTYTESGYSWSMYNYPEEAWYDEAYPPERYDSLSLCLSMEDARYTGSMSERYAARQENTDLWLVAYVDRDTYDITLQDIDDTGVFGGETFVPLMRVQQG